MARNTSDSFDNAVMELVKYLDNQELNSIIAEAETVWPDVAMQELARIETRTAAKLKANYRRGCDRCEIDAVLAF